MGLIAVQNIGVTGLKAVYSAADVADSFNPGAGVLIHFKTGANACTITFSPKSSTIIKQDLGPVTVPDRTLVLSTTEDGFIFLPPGFPVGSVPVYTDDTNLTHAVLKGV